MGETEIWSVQVGDDHEMLLLRSAGDRWPRAALLLGAPGSVGRINQGLLRKLNREAFARGNSNDGPTDGPRTAFLGLLLQLCEELPDAPQRPQAPSAKGRLRSLVDQLAMLVESIPEADHRPEGLNPVDPAGWQRGRWLLWASATTATDGQPLLFFLVPFRPQGFEGPSSSLPEGSITTRPICADGRLVTTRSNTEGIGVQLPGMTAWLTDRRVESVLDFIADDEAHRVAASIAALRARLDGKSPTAAYNGLLAGRYKFPQETSTEIHRRMRLVSRALRNESDRHELMFLAPPGIDVARLSDEVLRLEPDVIAETHYERNGWQIIARNIFNGRGKIDFIAERGDEIIVCEVKTGKSADFSGGESTVSPLLLWERLGSRARAVAENVRGAAFDWAQKNGVPADQLRFDVALVVDDTVIPVHDAF